MDLARPTAQSPRQMWDLDPEVEKRLATRSIWVRGLGVGAKTEEVLPILERTGDKTQRVRIYRMGRKDRWGEFAVYATYHTEEAADLNMTRLCSHTHRTHRLTAKKASPEGAYRPLTQQIKNRIALKGLTKDDRIKLINKKKAQLKLDKIRQLNGKIREVTGSPASEGGSQITPEASRLKEDSKLKRKSSDDASTSTRDAVDKKRRREDDRTQEPIAKDTTERKGERERRGPRTPPGTPPNIDRRGRDDRLPFLNRADKPGPSTSPKRHHRGGQKKRREWEATKR